MATTTTTFTGHLTATGDVTGAYLYGNGSNITNIAAVTIPAAANHAATFDGTGALSHEARLSNVRGGTGADTSAATGYAYVSAGTWSFDNNPSVTISATANAQKIYGSPQTTDATVTSACSFSMTPTGANTKSAATITITSACGKTGDGAGSVNAQKILAKYDVSFNSVGSAATITALEKISSGTLATTDVTVTNTGATININVKGVLATTLNWVVAAEYVKTSFPN
jgi:hypothetical protein